MQQGWFIKISYLCAPNRSMYIYVYDNLRVLQFQLEPVMECLCLSKIILFVFDYHSPDDWYKYQSVDGDVDRHIEEVMH